MLLVFDIIVRSQMTSMYELDGLKKKEHTFETSKQSTSNDQKGQQKSML